jgi:hypothetical protein
VSWRKGIVDAADAAVAGAPFCAWQALLITISPNMNSNVRVFQFGIQQLQ